MKKLIQKPSKSNSAREGFTIIEVMLSLAISALMLIGVIGGVYISIDQQRYSDALRDFAEYMRTVYSEVISPQSLGLGNSNNQAILGKVLVFHYSVAEGSTVQSATIVGDTSQINVTTPDLPFLASLSSADAHISLICGNGSNQPSTVTSYTPLWQTQLMQSNDGGDSGEAFTGTMIIARSLTSATVHTAFYEGVTYDLENRCALESTAFVAGINTTNYNMTNPTRICVKMDGHAVSRQVNIAADGRNTSAVHILTESESNCNDV